MNVAYEVWILGVGLIFAVLLALLLGDQVETGLRVRSVKIFLRYRRNRRK